MKADTQPRDDMARVAKFQALVHRRVTRMLRKISLDGLW